MAMRVCILGAGGLGSLVGGMLAESGLRVTLVGRPEHVEAIRQGGLRISGISGERRIVGGLDAVESAARVRGPFDALILCVKAKDTEAVLRDANGLRADAGVVFSLQNTIAKDAALAEWIGRDRVVGASTTEAATMDGAGSVRHVATAPTALAVIFTAVAPTVMAASPTATSAEHPAVVSVRPRVMAAASGFGNIMWVSCSVRCRSDTRIDSEFNSP